MIELIVHTEQDGGAFKDFTNRKIIHLGNEAGPLRIASLRRGMASGKPSVAFGFELPTGEVVIAETSLVLFLNAADTLRARHKGEL